MAGFERQVTITWEGAARDGAGELKAGSGAFSLPVSLPGRVSAAVDSQTSPEELLAAAHAACYAMALAATLARRNATAVRLHVSATVRSDYSEAGLVVQASHLRVLADGLSGMEHERFAEAAREAEVRCPISNVLRGNVRIDLEALA